MMKFVSLFLLVVALCVLKTQSADVIDGFPVNQIVESPRRGSELASVASPNLLNPSAGSTTGNASPSVPPVSSAPEGSKVQPAVPPADSPRPANPVVNPNAQNWNPHSNNPLAAKAPSETSHSGVRGHAGTSGSVLAGGNVPARDNALRPDTVSTKPTNPNGGVQPANAAAPAEGSNSGIIMLSIAGIALCGVIGGVWAIRRWKLSPSPEFKARMNPEADYYSRRSYGSDAAFARELRQARA